MTDREMLQMVLVAFAETIHQTIDDMMKEGYRDFPHVHLNDAAQRLALFTMPTAGETKQ